MVEGARLESVYTSKAYRGFESHPLRQLLFPSYPPTSLNARKIGLFTGFSVSAHALPYLRSPRMVWEIVWEQFAWVS